MSHAEDQGSYLLEEVEIEEDSDNEDYQTVEVEDLPGFEIQKNIPLETETNMPLPFSDDHQPVIVQRNEVVDDFVRNFLKRMGMTETLAAFQQEWYSTCDHPLFRDLSEQIQYKKQQIAILEEEKKKWVQVSIEVQNTWGRLKQETKYHKEALIGAKKDADSLNNDLRELKKVQKHLDPAKVELEKKFIEVNKERSILRNRRNQLRDEIAKMQQKSPDHSPNE